MRGRADRDAPGPPGPSGARGRSGVVPERHRLDARDPRTGNRRAEPLGAARPGDSHRLPPGRDLFVRLRADHDRRDASPSRRHLDGVRAAANRPRQDPRRCRFRRGCRGARTLHRRGHRHRGRRGRRDPRPRRRRQERARAGPCRHRRRRAQLACRQGCPAPPVQRQADAPVELLHVLERSAR